MASLPEEIEDSDTVTSFKQKKIMERKYLHLQDVQTFNL